MTSRSARPDDDDRHIDEHIVEQAVDWYVRDASGQQSLDDRTRFADWIAAHPDHGRAWQRLRGIGQALRGPREHLPPRIALGTLDRAALVDPNRRRLLKTLGWGGAAGAALYLLRDRFDWQAMLDPALADARTATGEIRDLRLADGTRVMLNTATAIDIDYSDLQRRIVLLAGEILVETGAKADGRALVIETRDGSVTPRGTRFTVRRTSRSTDAGSLVAVNEGAVRIQPTRASAATLTEIGAGWQIGFDRDQAGAATRLRESRQAWTDGMLVAERQRLADLLAELDRYRPGRLRCAPEVADLRITGTWPLVGVDATDRILSSLERRLPVRVQRISPYWAVVGPTQEARRTRGGGAAESATGPSSGSG